MSKPEIQYLSEHYPSIIAGLLGAIVNVYKNPQKSKLRNFAEFLTGAVFTTVATPAIMDLIGRPIQWEPLIALVLGLIGIKAMEYIIDELPEILDQKIQNIIKK
jgi:hypothetical protein